MNVSGGAELSIARKPARQDETALASDDLEAPPELVQAESEQAESETNGNNQEETLLALLREQMETMLQERLVEIEARMEAKMELKMRQQQQSQRSATGGPTLLRDTSKPFMRKTGSFTQSISDKSLEGAMVQTGSSGGSLKSPGKHSTVSSIGAIEEATPSQFFLMHSAWDVSMLIGLDVVGTWESILLVLLMCLTLLVTLVFCGIVLTNFTSPGFEDDAIRQLQAWRLNTAHMYSEVDSITGITLASRACNLDRGLATSAEQVATIDAIRNYLSQDGVWISSGPAMCLTALVLWYLTLIREFARIMRCGRGFTLLPNLRGDRAVVSGNRISLVSISYSRKVWVVLATLMRLGVLGILSYSGTLYIVYTIEVKDLLLNCIALEVILHIDDLAFTSLTSSKLLAKVDMMAPLPLRSVDRQPGVMARMWGAVAISLVGLALALAGTQVLLPYTDRLQRVEQTLCGGQVDFAVFVMDEVGVPIMSYTPPFTPMEQGLEFSQRAIHRAILLQGSQSSLTDAFAFVVDQGHFHEFKSFAANADGYPGPDNDFFMDIAVVSTKNDTDAYLARLRDLLGDETATCSTLQGSPLCFAYNSVSSALRFLCPVSCGCGTLHSGIYMDTNGYCPDGSLDEIEALLEHLPCADNSSAMQRIGSVQAHGFPSDTSCAEIAEMEPWCAKTSVAAFCPVSCRCSSTGYGFCPPSCTD